MRWTLFDFAGGDCPSVPAPTRSTGRGSAMLRPYQVTTGCRLSVGNVQLRFMMLKLRTHPGVA